MKKSWPDTSTRGSAEPSAGNDTSSFATSPSAWRSRTQITVSPSGVTTPSA